RHDLLSIQSDVESRARRAHLAQVAGRVRLSPPESLVSDASTTSGLASSIFTNPQCCSWVQSSILGLVSRVALNPLRGISTRRAAGMSSRGHWAKSSSERICGTLFALATGTSGGCLSGVAAAAGGAVCGTGAGWEVTL